MIKSFILGLASSLLVLTAVSPVVVHAVQNGGVGGRPAYPSPNNSRTQSIFIFQLSPGQSAGNGVKVINNTGQAQAITLDSVDSELASGGAFTCKQASEPKTGVGSWIHLQTTTLNLAPDSNQTVPFTITAPVNADVGEHDGCITIQAASQTAKKSDTNGILLSFRSAIRVVATIPGKITKNLSIKNVKVLPAKGSLYEISTTVQNTGNVSLDTSIRISLVSVFGNNAASVKEGTSPVLPKSSASWNYEIKKPFWGGLYRASVVATYNDNPASELGAGQSTDQTSKTLSSGLFLVAPQPGAAAIEFAVLLVILAGVYWLIRRKLNKKHVQNHWQEYSVKKGDTLHKLASDRGVSWKQIAKANKLKAPYHLETGQTIKLPPKKD